MSTAQTAPSPIIRKSLPPDVNNGLAAWWAAILFGLVALAGLTPVMPAPITSDKGITTLGWMIVGAMGGGVLIFGGIIAAGFAGGSRSSLRLFQLGSVVGLLLGAGAFALVMFLMFTSKGPFLGPADFLFFRIAALVLMVSLGLIPAGMSFFAFSLSKSTGVLDFFEMRCPNCGSYRVKPLDFFQTKLQCGEIECGHVWPEVSLETIPAAPPEEVAVEEPAPEPTAEELAATRQFEPEATESGLESEVEETIITDAAGTREVAIEDAYLTHVTAEEKKPKPEAVDTSALDSILEEEGVVPAAREEQPGMQSTISETVEIQSPSQIQETAEAAVPEDLAEPEPEEAVAEAADGEVEAQPAEGAADEAAVVEEEVAAPVPSVPKKKKPARERWPLAWVSWLIAKRGGRKEKPTPEPVAAEAAVEPAPELATEELAAEPVMEERIAEPAAVEEQKTIDELHTAPTDTETDALTSEPESVELEADDVEAEEVTEQVPALEESTEPLAEAGAVSEEVAVPAEPAKKKKRLPAKGMPAWVLLALIWLVVGAVGVAVWIFLLDLLGTLVGWIVIGVLALAGILITSFALKGSRKPAVEKVAAGEPTPRLNEVEPTTEITDIPAVEEEQPADIAEVEAEEAELGPVDEAGASGFLGTEPESAPDTSAGAEIDVDDWLKDEPESPK